MKRKQKVIEGFWDRMETVIFNTGLSKCELARRMQCDRKILIQEKSEGRMLSAGNIATFCAVTGTDANWLLGVKR